MLLVVGPTLLFAKDLARILLGPEFREGYLVMPIALGGIALWQLGLYLHKPFEFYERTGIMLGLAALAVTVSLVLNILLIPRFGYMAAAWNTVAAYGVYAGLTGALARRQMPWRIEWTSLLVPSAGLLTGLLILGWVRGLLRPAVPYPVELAISLTLLSLILLAAGSAIMRMLRHR
jgi:O-antigen/teichoic acid export membrane protein